jgi:hypothetical protein
MRLALTVADAALGIILVLEFPAWLRGIRQALAARRERRSR